jgi:hypothetical protein
MQSNSVLIRDMLDHCLTEILENGKELEECLNQFPDQREILRPLIELSLHLQKGSRISLSSAEKDTRLIRMKELTGSTPQVRFNTSQIPHSKQSAFRRLRLALSLCILFLAVITFGFTSIVFASNSAIPGNYLYPLKIKFEQLELTLSKSGVKNSELHLEIAERRLDEASVLLQTGNQEGVEVLLDEFQTHINIVLEAIEKNPDLSSEQRAYLIKLINQWLEQNLSELISLYSHVPESERFLILKTFNSSRLSHDRVIKLFGELPEFLKQEDGKFLGGKEIPVETGSPTSTRWFLPTDFDLEKSVIGTDIKNTVTAQFTKEVSDPAATSLPAKIATKIATLWPTDQVLPTGLPTNIATPIPPAERATRTPREPIPTRSPAHRISP